MQQSFIVARRRVLIALGAAPSGLISLNAFAAKPPDEKGKEHGCK